MILILTTLTTVTYYDISFPHGSEDDVNNVELQANCRDTVRRLLSSYSCANQELKRMEKGTEAECSVSLSRMLQQRVNTKLIISKGSILLLKSWLLLFLTQQSCLLSIGKCLKAEP